MCFSCHLQWSNVQNGDLQYFPNVMFSQMHIEQHSQINIPNVILWSITVDSCKHILPASGIEQSCNVPTKHKHRYNRKYCCTHMAAFNHLMPKQTDSSAVGFFYNATTMRSKRVNYLIPAVKGRIPGLKNSSDCDLHLSLTNLKASLFSIMN